MKSRREPARGRLAFAAAAACAAAPSLSSPVPELVAKAKEILERGKDATLFVSDRDVLDFRYRVEAAYVDGRPLDLSDRHKRLWERYRNRPKPGK